MVGVRPSAAGRTLETTLPVLGVGGRAGAEAWDAGGVGTVARPGILAAEPVGRDAVEANPRVARRMAAMKYRFGEQFAGAVRIRGLTVSQLAERAGVSPGTVAAALHGREVQIRTALRIARAVSEAPVVPALEEWAEGGLDGA